MVRQLLEETNPGGPDRAAGRVQGAQGPLTAGARTAKSGAAFGRELSRRWFRIARSSRRSATKPAAHEVVVHLTDNDGLLTSAGFFRTRVHGRRAG